MEKHVFKSPGQIVINQIYRTLGHFCPELGQDLAGLPDTRERKQYHSQELCMAGITMFMFKEGSRNAYNNERKDKQFRDNYSRLFGLTLPHLDTVDDYMRELPDLEFEKVKVNTISSLIRKKVFSSGKFRGHYIVAIDGTGIASFDNRHCESCLSKTSKNGVTSYFHNVLEAKLLTPSGMSLSIATEWISNQGKKSYQKQDCERAAFIRLAASIKNYYPRLPMVIVADGLYPWKGFFDICRQNDWKYIITLKDGNLKSLQEEIRWEKRLNHKQTREVVRADKNTLTTLTYPWLSGLTYRNHSLNWVECIEKKVSRATGNIIQQRFVHLTNMEISSELCAGISDTGRLRQKIENEGFNIQKNNGYALEHKYSRVSFQAMKNYYQCLQIAHIINQLVQASQTIKTLLDKTLKCTVKHLWKRLLSFLSEREIIESELIDLVSRKFQIRLL